MLGGLRGSNQPKTRESIFYCFARGRLVLTRPPKLSRILFSFTMPLVIERRLFGLFCRCRFRSRTPGPPPFSSMNSTPAIRTLSLIRTGLLRHSRANFCLNAFDRWKRQACLFRKLGLGPPQQSTTGSKLLARNERKMRLIPFGSFAMRIHFGSKMVAGLNSTTSSWTRRGIRRIRCR